MKVAWDIRREGRAWTGAEAQDRWQLTPERLEMSGGKLLWDSEDYWAAGWLIDLEFELWEAPWRDLATAVSSDCHLVPTTVPPS